MLPRRTLLAAPALLLGAAERMPLAAVPVGRLETGWWRARHEAKLREIKSRRIDLVWLGDSITEDWELSGPEAWRNFVPGWMHFYGDRNALNLGFKGDTTAHLLWRMANGELEGVRPKVAVILIGANNMGRVHWTAPQTVAGIEAVVNDARARLPDAKLVLFCVLPSIRNRYVSRTTEQVNRELLARYAGGAVPGVTLVDASRVFVRNGEVDRTQFLDDLLNPPDPPLHPTAQAQGELAALIEPAVAAGMGDRAKPGLTSLHG